MTDKEALDKAKNAQGALAFANYTNTALYLMRGFYAVFACFAVFLLVVSIASAGSDRGMLIFVSIFMMGFALFLAYISEWSMANYHFGEDALEVAYLWKFRGSLRIPYTEMREVDFSSYTYRGNTTYYLHLLDGQGRKHKLSLKDWHTSQHVVALLKEKGLVSEDSAPFIEQREANYDPKSRRNNKILYMVLLALAVNTCSYYYGGTDSAHSEDRHNEYYNGSASFTELPIYFYWEGNDVVNLDGVSAHWEYGFNPSYKMEEMNLQVVETSIPDGMMGKVFVEAGKYELQARTLYYGLLDIRSNYWSFLARDQYAFELFSLEAVDPSLSPAKLEKQTSWHARITLYVLASHIQFTALGLFFVMLSYSAPMREGVETIVFRKSKRAIAFNLWLGLMYVLSTAYKTASDMPYLSNWWWIWYGMLNLAGMYIIYESYKQIRDSKDFVRLDIDGIAYKDNATEGQYKYSDIKQVEAVGLINDKGKYTYSGKIKLSLANGTEVLIPLADMNLGSCDLEIFTALKKAIGQE